MHIQHDLLPWHRLGHRTQQVWIDHHAQFETIHPFEDGNGRVGRALFHGFLKARRSHRRGAIPLSTVLGNDVDGYVEASTKFRYDDRDRGPALPAYVDQFPGYVGAAVSAAARFLADNLGVSTVSAQRRVKQLESVGIVRAA